MRLFALILPLALLAPSAFAQSDAELERYDDLDRRCEAARERALAPIRARLIQACVTRDKQPSQECEEAFARYGNTRGKAGGGAVGGMFYDLPECLAASKARERYRQ